ncbi:MAG TPA: hypothetical protein VII63_03460 [Caulobacteraceae bacterium]
MRGAFSALFLAVASAGSAMAGAPSVSEQAGAIEYRDGAGVARSLARGAEFSEPVLSPDGRTVAFIRADSAAASDENPPTSLWLADGPSGKLRRLLASRRSDDVKANLASFHHPLFSLDGHFIYVSADAWATSPAVHQVNVATGAERFVIDGGVVALIRTGPLRGYLLVRRHKYHPAPRYGSYDPIYVVRPDAKEMLVVPGTDLDDDKDHLAPWLQAKGWRAW